MALYVKSQDLFEKSQSNNYTQEDMFKGKTILNSYDPSEAIDNVLEHLFCKISKDANVIIEKMQRIVRDDNLLRKELGLHEQSYKEYIASDANELINGIETFKDKDNCESKVFKQSLCSVFCSTDVFLRKYEESVVTLPKGYQTTQDKSQIGHHYYSYNANDNNDNVDGLFSVFNVDTEKELKVKIRYTRHFLPIDNNGMIETDTLYIEPLSGSQSYLTMLDNITPGNDDGLLTKLVENALLRILVIDERVHKFLFDHPKLIATFSVMGMWVLNTTDNPNPNGATLSKPLNKFNNAQTEILHRGLLEDKDETLKYIRKLFEKNKDELVLEKPASEEVSSNIKIYLDNLKVEHYFPGNFDIIIIHQGVIDKWFPKDANNSAVVAMFLEWLKRVDKAGTRRHVVVTTGRGKPDSIPANACILPFSSIENCLFKQYPEKLILTNTIMSLCRKDLKND